MQSVDFIHAYLPGGGIMQILMGIITMGVVSRERTTPAAGFSTVAVLHEVAS
jgi:hypothetical protein